MAKLGEVLDAYLEDAARTPFAWGQTDCMLWVGGWVRCATGLDPAAPWRGRYRTERGALRLVARAGGLDRLMAQAAGRVGLAEALRPIRGDVGVLAVLTPRGPSLAAGLFCGRRWALRGPRGLLMTQDQALAAWAVAGRA